MNPTLTVIVPVFNRAHIVRDTLDSIARQRVAPDCLIVVDNNSTDASAETVKQWISEYSGPMRCEFASEPKPGSAAARNRGLALADTELVSFFDSDDKVRPDYAESIKEAFSSDPQLDLVYWAVKHHPIAGRPRRLRFSSRGDIAFQIFHSFLATQRFAVKRDFFIRVEGWDESVFVWNDWELGIRMLLHHPRMRSIRRHLRAGRQHHRPVVLLAPREDRVGSWPCRGRHTPLCLCRPSAPALAPRPAPRHPGRPLPPRGERGRRPPSARRGGGIGPASSRGRASGPSLPHGRLAHVARHARRRPPQSAGLTRP